MSSKLERRAFLLSLMATGLTATAAGADPMPATAAEPAAQPARPVRGVNLGGWLVLEKWLVPSVFTGTEAADEYGLCQALGANAADRLRAHRDSFITEDDFKWIASCGLNAVRLPVGYWILEGDKPFIGAPDVLDRAFKLAGDHGLGVLLDLHGAPGSQNGWDHSGRAGALEWYTKKENIARTLDIVDNLAAHCSRFPNLIGIELLNEPRWDVPLEVLKQYYQDGYRRTRRHLGKERATVVIHDSFRPFEWADFMHEPDYANVVLDTHLYQCFEAEDQKRSITDQVIRALQRKQQIEKMQQQLPVYVGEWSLALQAGPLEGLTSLQQDVARRAFGDAQLLSYEASHGWFFWTYKTEDSLEWSLRECVQRGWLPSHFGAAVPPHS